MLRHPLFWTAKELLFHGQYVDALNLFTKILTEEPDDLDVKKWLIECLIKTGNYENALTACEEAIIKYPEEFEVYLLKSYSLEGLRKKNEYINILDQILSIFPDSLKILVKKTLLTQITQGDHAAYDFIQEIHKISNKYPTGKYPNKVGTYPEYVNRDGHYFYHELLEYRVWTHYVKGSDKLKSFTLLDQALQYHFYMRTQQNIKNVEFPMALVIQKPIYDTERRSALPNELNGDLFEIELDEVFPRNISLRKIPKYYSESYKSKMHWANRGNIYLQLDKFDDALNCFDNSLLIDKSYLYGYLGKSCAYAQKGDLPKGIEILNNTIVNLIDPSNESLSLVCFQKGNLFFMTKQYDVACKLYTKAAEYDPLEYRIYAMYAETLKAMNQISDYNAMYNKALETLKQWKPKYLNSILSSENRKTELYGHDSQEKPKKEIPKIPMDQVPTLSFVFLSNIIDAFKRNDYNRTIEVYEGFMAFMNSYEIDLGIIPYEILINMENTALISYLKRNKSGDKNNAFTLATDLHRRQLEIGSSDAIRTRAIIQNLDEQLKKERNNR